jgi:predicted DNA-binding transcriptional regulator AlpA
LVGIGQPGRLALEFTRQAASAQAAVRSALTDVKRAIPSAKLVEAAPDFVGLTDVAELVGVSRQAMRKLMLSHAGSFPMPVHEGSTSIWHLAEVLAWLEPRDGYVFEAQLIETAQAALEVNLANEARRLAPAVAQELERLVA